MINRNALARDAFFGNNQELDNFIRMQKGKLVNGKLHPSTKISLKECLEVIDTMTDKQLMQFIEVTA